MILNGLHQRKAHLKYKAGSGNSLCLSSQGSIQSSWLLYGLPAQPSIDQSGHQPSSRLLFLALQVSVLLGVILQLVKAIGLFQ